MSNARDPGPLVLGRCWVGACFEADADVSDSESTEHLRWDHRCGRPGGGPVGSGRRVQHDRGHARSRDAVLAIRGIVRERRRDTKGSLDGPSRGPARFCVDESLRRPPPFRSSARWCRSKARSRRSVRRERLRARPSSSGQGRRRALQCPFNLIHWRSRVPANPSRLRNLEERWRTVQK